MERRRGSHPPTLLTRVERAVVDHGLLTRGNLVLVACSGGPDSTALLHALALVGRRRGFSVAAHGVDHGLRAEASRELDVAESVARSLGVSFSRSRVDVGPGGNLQARARSARYASLREAATALGARAIATAHTADDRAETLLMRLVRGTGPRGLAVLPPKSGDLIRPAIAARRADVLAHLARHRLPFADDPSNVDPRFVRVRVRREVMPLLETLSPRVVEALNALADSMVELELPDDPVNLPRRAREQLADAARRGKRRVTLRVEGGRDVEVDLHAPLARSRAR